MDWVEGNHANIDFKLEQLHEANDLYRAADIVARGDLVFFIDESRAFPNYRENVVYIYS